MRGTPTAPRTLRLPLGRRLPRGSRYAAGLAGTALVLLAIAAAVGPWPRATAAGVAGTLVAAAAIASRVLGRRRQPPHGWLVLDDAGVHRVNRAGQATLLVWDEPFGLTVLASADRATLLLALTSARA